MLVSIALPCADGMMRLQGLLLGPPPAWHRLSSSCSHGALAGFRLQRRVRWGELLGQRRRGGSGAGGFSAMADAGASSADAAVASSVSYERGRKPIVIQPKGKHLVTVVWLHGLGDSGYGWQDSLEDLPLPNVKWILPTAPTRPVTVNGGLPCNAWFDVGSLTSETLDDVQGLDASAALVADLLVEHGKSGDGTPVKLVVGGFSMGAATSLYTATRYVAGKYGSGKPFVLPSLDAVVGLSGWLPRAKVAIKEASESAESAQRAAELPVFIAHGTADWVVAYNFGERSKAALESSGYNNVVFKRYEGLPHSASVEEFLDLVKWLKETLTL